MPAAARSTRSPLRPLSRAYGQAARGPLGTYNFAGDIGKAALPPAVSLLMTVMQWRSALCVVAGLGVVVALLIGCLMPATRPQTVRNGPAASAASAAGKGGFGLLLAIGVLDSAARMGFLLFLPFLLRAKGAPLTTVGLALSLIFIGGACGKATCGWLGARIGLLATVIMTEAGTTALILAVLALPLVPSMVLLPLSGVMLNGTSSVLYGTVPELVTNQKVERAFALVLLRHARIECIGTRAIRSPRRCSGAGLGDRRGGCDGIGGRAAHPRPVAPPGVVHAGRRFMRWR